jgi:hypothetical protein
MERVEMVGGSTFVLKTRQVGPSCWCCDVYERIDNVAAESFMFEDFGESETEAIQMAMHDAHGPHQIQHH